AGDRADGAGPDGDRRLRADAVVRGDLRCGGRPGPGARRVDDARGPGGTAMDALGTATLSASRARTWQADGGSSRQSASSLRPASFRPAASLAGGARGVEIYTRITLYLFVPMEGFFYLYAAGALAQSREPLPS